MDRQLSSASLTSENARSMDMLASFGELNHADINENDLAQLDAEDSGSIIDKMNKLFGHMSITQRNLTLDENSTKPFLVCSYIST